MDRSDREVIAVPREVLPDLGLVAFLNYGEDRVLANQLLAGFTLAP